MDGLCMEKIIFPFYMEEFHWHVEQLQHQPPLTQHTVLLPNIRAGFVQKPMKHTRVKHQDNWQTRESTVDGALVFFYT